MIAATLVVLLLIGGVVGTTRGLFEAKAQTDIARRETKAKGDALRAEAAANDELTHRLDVSEMALASAAWENRDVKLTTERLEKVPARSRGWEWQYLKRQSIGGIFTVKHGETIACLAVSPDGTRFATASGHWDAPFEVKMWDARTGALLFELKGLPENVRGIMSTHVCIAFSADGKRIVTARGDKVARLWDATTGALQLELIDRTAEAGCAAFSPDGTRVATGHDGGRLKVWDAKTGAVELDIRAHPEPVVHLAFSPDGTRIATGAQDHCLYVLDAKTGTQVLAAKGLMSGDGTVEFSPDGKRIVVGGHDGKGAVIDATTGAIQLELKGRTLPGQIVYAGNMDMHCAAFSPDGSRIITGGGVSALGEAIVWDAKTGAALIDLRGHNGHITSVAFSPDGLCAITGCSDGTAKVWDARTGTPRLEFDGIPAMVLDIALSRDGTRLVIGGGVAAERSYAAIWDAHRGEVVMPLKGTQGAVTAVAISPEGTRVFTGAGEDENASQALVWDALSGAILFELGKAGASENGLRQRVHSAAFSHDGNLIATVGLTHMTTSSEVKIWNAHTGALVRDLSQDVKDRRHEFGVKPALAFNADSTRLLVAGARSPAKLGAEARVWNVTTGDAQTTVDTKHEGGVRCAAFSPDGTRFVTGGSDNAARVFDATSGALLVELKGHTGHISGVAFTPDGARIITAGSDHNVRIWDARTGTTLAELKGHSGPAGCLAVSADGNRIFSGSRKMVGPSTRGEVFVWEARAGNEPPDEEELVYRRLWTGPNLPRYRERYLAAIAAENAFSAAFYLNLVPPAERAALKARGDDLALAALSLRAQVFSGTGRPQEALPLLIEVWSINKARLGPDDPVTLADMGMVCTTYGRVGQHDKAIALSEELLKLHTSKFGADNPETLSAISHFAVILKNAGQFQKAIALLEAPAAKEENDYLLHQLIELYKLAGEHGKAADRLLKSLETIRKTTPAEHLPMMLSYTQAQISDAYLAQKKWPEAEPHLREALAFREKSQPDEWTTFQTQSALGASLLGQKRYAEAHPLLLKGYEGLKQREGSIPLEEHLTIPKALDRLIELHAAMNNPDEVKKWQAERAKYPTAP